MFGWLKAQAQKSHNGTMSFSIWLALGALTRASADVAATNRSHFLGRSAVEVSAQGAKCGPLDLPQNANCNWTGDCPKILYDLGFSHFLTKGLQFVGGWDDTNQARRWWNGPHPAARMTPVPAVGTTTCPASQEWSIVKVPWRISKGSTTVPLRARTNFAACHLALVAATLPATIALQGISCTPPCGPAAMATTEALDVSHPSRLWATRANIGQPPWCTAFRRCTSLPLATGVAWTDPWIPMRAVPTLWPTTGENGLDPVFSPGVAGTRHTLWSSVTTTSWWNVSTLADNLPALPNAATCQAIIWMNP